MSTRAVNLDTLTIETFARAIRSGELTAEAVTEACLERIAAENPRLNAFITVTADAARAHARAADQELASGRDRGSLHGVPVSVKDLIDVAGLPTTAASRVRQGHVAEHDAAAIVALREAGAVLIGKTNLHEFAFGTTNEESAFGPARNPLDASRSPGGSSGGSAASVAAGMALATIGTDTGGSIRIPAAACGIVGLKPRFGEISTDGVVPLSRRLDHVGPLARTVVDTALVHRALRGGTAARGPAPLPISGLRVAVPRDYFCDLLDAEVRQRFDEALDRLRAAGVRVSDVTLRHAPLTAATYVHLVLADAAAVHAVTLEQTPELYTAPVRLRLEMGRYVLAEDYVRALEAREILRREVDSTVAAFDAIALPTLPIPAPALGAVAFDFGGRSEPIRNLMLRLTQLFDLTGHPAIAIPAGATSAGLPCSLQLAGADTDQLLRVAAACEPHITGVPSPRSGGGG
jgi:aspartyl-tRNA(Asn)/glutamyl-tRNA(Gln) amidotransferase subunit A